MIIPFGFCTPTDFDSVDIPGTLDVSSCFADNMILRHSASEYSYQNAISVVQLYSKDEDKVSLIVW